MFKLLHMINRRLVILLPSELNTNDFNLLLSPRKHSILLNQRRSIMIVNRVRLFAMLFAVLTPFWGILDILAFSSPLWIKLILLRLMASIMLVFLFMCYRSTDNLLNAYRAMAILFIILLVFYILSHLFLTEGHPNGLSGAVATGYTFLPFILLSALAIFPLSLVEYAVVAAVLLAAQLLDGFFHWSTLSWISFTGYFGLLVFIAGVTALANISQLAFMLTLVRQAIHDPLTGMLTRGSGKEILYIQWAAAQRNQQPLALAFIDLDHFKAVNDDFGHDAGDQVLRMFAKQIGKRIRSSDSILRWGGEEFLIIMPNTSLDQAVLAMQSIQKNGFGFRPDGKPLTVSIGLVERNKDQLQDIQQLLLKADQRMYQAKQAGRNQVCASG